MRAWLFSCAAAAVLSVAVFFLLHDVVPGPERSQGQQTLVTNGARWLLTIQQSKQGELAGLLPGGTRSVLRIEHRLRHGDFVWNDDGVPPGPLQIRVDLTSQTISAFRSGHEIGAAVILYGAAGMDTPAGGHAILTKIRDHRSGTYGAPMPYTLRLTADGVAIHGSDVRWGFATHGCVGVPLEFARRLFDHAAVGDVVEVVRNDATSRPEPAG